MIEKSEYHTVDRTSVTQLSGYPVCQLKIQVTSCKLRVSRESRGLDLFNPFHAKNEKPITKNNLYILHLMLTTND